jgi:hypothetical protein
MTDSFLMRAAGGAALSRGGSVTRARVIPHGEAPDTGIESLYGGQPLELTITTHRGSEAPR